MCVTQWGISVIVVRSDLPARKWVPVLAHEFAHAKLHAGDLGEASFHVAPCTPGDPRERDAQYLATCLLLGPGVDVAWPDVPHDEPATPVAPAVVAPVTPSRSGLPPWIKLVVHDPYTDPVPVRPTRIRGPVATPDPDSALAHALRVARKKAKPLRRFD